MKFATLILLLSTFLGISIASAQNGASRSMTLVVVLHDKRTFQDGPVVRVKEVETGKVAQITLRKAAKIPDAWANFFLIHFSAGDSSSKTIEFYTLKNIKYLTYFRSDKKVQRVDLFRDDETMNKFIAQEEQKAAMKAAKRIQGKKSVTVSLTSEAPKTRTSKKSAEEEAEELRQKTLQQEQARLSLEEQQAKARLAQLEQQRLLSAAQKEQNEKKSRVLVAEGDAAYAKEDYATSTKKYAESLQLTPDNDAIYYKYGISLYKTDDYIQSLATLSLADVSDTTALEKDYYVALNYFKLKDNDKALAQFKELREENDPSFSPTASYFAGNIEYQQQKFDDARKSMEYTIDNSNDPALANSAESFLDQIDRAESYYNSKKEKYRATFFGGLTYDTNVLNIAANNISTDVKAVRLNAGASLLGIWHRDMKSDFGTEVSVSDYYSMNSGFQGDATLQTADPLEAAILLPYHREITLGKSPASLEVVPLYRSIYMSPTGGSREQVISSLGLNSTLAFALSQEWYFSSRVDISMDKSYLSSAADDDQSGNKFGLILSPTKILDLRGQRTLSGDLSYYTNQAEGKNNKYNRIGLGFTYGFPSLWASQGTVRIGYDSQNYPEASVTRTDKVTSVMLASSKDLNSNLNFVGSFVYNNSSSEVTAYNYDKYIVMGLFTYRMSYLEK
jgi:TolA-binding protein